MINQVPCGFLGPSTLGPSTLGSSTKAPSFIGSFKQSILPYESVHLIFVHI